MCSVQKLNEAYEYLRSLGKVHTKKELAEAMGANRVNISKAFSGDTKYLTESFLVRLNNTFGNIFDEKWLWGEGSNMLKEEYEAKTSSPIPLNNKHEMCTPEIINFILEQEGIKAAKFAQLIDVTPTQIYDLLSGKTKKISENMADKILSAFPSYSKIWLLTGDKSVIEASPVSTTNTGEFYTENNNGVKFYDLKNGKFRMDVKKVPFCAYGRFANEADTLEPDKEDWEEESFECDQIVHGKYFAFEIKGDSMDDGTRDSFEEGDTVLVRELGRQHWINGLRYKQHPYWVIVFDSSVLIKQIVAQDLQRGELTFHSLNPSPEYHDFSLNFDDIRALYYVLQKKPKTVRF